MQQYPQAKSQVKTPVLVFLKVVGPPLVLYVDNAEEFYADLKKIIESANEKNPKLIERKANGPLKTIAIMDTQIAGVAIQEETYLSY